MTKRIKKYLKLVAEAKIESKEWKDYIKEKDEEDARILAHLKWMSTDLKWREDQQAGGAVGAGAPYSKELVDAMLLVGELETEEPEAE